MTDVTTVSGHSDDLIELDGAIYEEFNYSFEEHGDLLAFSNGTVLRIVNTRGVWRISLVAGDADIVQAREDDTDNYTDRATVTGAKWVVFENEFVMAKDRT